MTREQSERSMRTNAYAAGYDYGTPESHPWMALPDPDRSWYREAYVAGVSARMADERRQLHSTDGFTFEIIH